MLPCTHRREELKPVSLCRSTKCGTKYRKTYKAFVCALFGRCIPELKEWQKQHREAEAKIYTLCRGCESRSPLE